MLNWLYWRVFGNGLAYRNRFWYDLAAMIARRGGVQPRYQLKVTP
jgi:hypothetical protein